MMGMLKSLDMSRSGIFSEAFLYGIGCLVLVQILRTLYVGLRERQKDYALTKKNGCQPPPEWSKRWPFGLDIFKQIWDANVDRRLLSYFCSIADEYAPHHNMSQFLLVGPKAYHIYEPRNVEAIQSTNFKDYGFGRRAAVFAPLLGDGIFTQEGAAWKHSRDLLRKQFVEAKYKLLDQAFGEHVENLMARIPEHGVVDLQPLFFGLTLDSATALLFGKSVYSLRQNTDQSSKEIVFSKSFDVALEALAKRFRIAPFHFLYNPRDFQQACRNVHAFVEDYIASQGLSKLNGSSETAQKSSAFTFIHQVAAESETDISLRDQLLNVLLAGRDTTACCLSWTVRLLVRHPDVLEKLRREVVSILGDATDPTREQIRKMPFLSFVIKESLRLYPLVPVNNRQATQTTVLPTGGGPDGNAPILVRKGERVIYSPYITARKQHIFGADANDFRPERWGTGELDGIGWAYFPFNGGPRKCLGEDFALMEVSYTLVRLLQRFPVIRLPDGDIVEPTGTEKQKLTLVLSPVDGCRVAIGA